MRSCCCRAMAASSSPPPCPPEDRARTRSSIAAAEWAMEHGEPAGRGSDTLAASEWLFQPLIAGGRALGVFGIASGRWRRSDALGPAAAAAQLHRSGGACARADRRSSREMASVAQLKERDRLRAALLSSVSHDLRTPLDHDPRRGGPDQGGAVEGLDPALADGSMAESRAAQPLRRQSARHGAGRGGRACSSSVEAVDLTDAVAAAVHDLRNRSKAIRSSWTCRPICRWSGSIRSSSTIA